MFGLTAFIGDWQAPANRLAESIELAVIQTDRALFRPGLTFA